MLISNEEKEVIAYHEAGHAILGILTGADPIHKVTIIPRGRALGITMHLPKDEKHIHPKSYWLNQIVILNGGYVAESIKYRDTSTGSSNDIERAPDIARRMVCEWGMSESMGPLTFGKKNEQIFLGREIAQHRDYSEATAEMIDAEVKRLIVESENKARELITGNIDKFEAIAKNLMERETLDAEEISLVMKGEALPPTSNNHEQKHESAPAEQ